MKRLSISTHPDGTQQINYCIRCLPIVDLVNKHTELKGIPTSPGLCTFCAPQVKRELRGKIAIAWQKYEAANIIRISR